jgi:tRNA (guanosine-2'-O-)-methyltransferase
MKKLITHLSQFLSPSRLGTFEKVLAKRTRYITVVLEDIYQSQNASAVLRSCDCLGMQDIHVIENRNKFDVDPEVVMGSFKWLNLHRYNKEEQNTISAIEKLRADGYRIIATSPHTDDKNLDDIDLGEGKMALLFGTELTGLSDNALAMADEYLKIPIVGFTESFNISVSAAIVLYQLSQKLRSSDIHWELEEQEADALMLEWLRKSIKKSELIENAFNKKK